MSKWEDNGSKVYNVVLQHCPSLRVLKIGRQPGFEKCKDDCDVAKLLKIIRDLTHKHDATKQ